MTTITNIKLGLGFDTYIGRANKAYGVTDSKWANPFVIGKDGNRAEVIKLYHEYILKRPELLKDLHEIDDKILACWCYYPKEDCHGRILIELRDRQKKEGNKVKLAVVGSRSIKNKKIVYDYLNKHKDRIDYIISGGAAGPDTFAHDWCKEYGFPIKVHYPDWNKGKSAGFARNCDIIRECTFAVIFWDGSSKGTKHDIDLCKDFGKNNKVIICND